MADKIKGITVQIGGDTGPLSKALKNVNKEIQTTQTQLKEVNKLLKLDPKNTELLKEKQSLLGKEIKSTKKELEALTQAQKQAKDMLANGEIGQEEYDQLGKKIEKAQKNLAKLEQEAKDTESKLRPTAEKVGAAFEKAGAKIEGVGKKLAPLSATAAAILGAGVKSAKDWESAFAGVMKTVDATKEEYEALGEGIQEMATRTASSAEDIAAVAEVAGQLGVAKEDLLEFTETMINLGDTTNLSATDAATALAQFINITGSSKKDIKKLGSAVVALGNNFATDEASIVNMSQRLAAAGTQAGLSETDILALAAAMSSVGIEAEAGGTAMSQTMTGIEKIVRGTAKNSSSKLQTLARVAGMSADAFAKAWKENPIEAIQAFIGGLGNLDTETESATEILDELGMSGVRQSGMLKSLALASDTLTGAIKTSNGAYKDNTALTQEASKRYGTFESQLSQTKEALKQIAVDIGEIVIPVVKDLLKGVKNAVTWFKSLDDGTKKTIVTITGIVAAVSPVLTIVGKLTSGLGSLVGGIGKLGKAFSGIGGPAALAVAGFAAVVAILKTYKSPLQKVYERYAKLTPEQEKLKNNLNEEAEAWAALKSSLKEAGKNVKAQADAEKKLWQELQKVVDENGNVIKGHEEEAKLLTTQLSEALGIEIELVGDQIKGYKELSENIGKVIEKKRGEALLAAGQEAYTKALQNRTKAAGDLATAEYNVLKAEGDLAAKQAELEASETALAEAQKTYNYETVEGAKILGDLEGAVNANREAVRGLTANLQDQKTTLSTAKGVLAEYDTTLANFDKLQAAVASGSTEDLQEAILYFVNNLQTAETSTEALLKLQTQTFIAEYGKQRDIVKKTGSQEAKSASVEMGKLVNLSIAELRKLNPKLADELQKQVNTINKSTGSWSTAGANTAKAYKSGFMNNFGLSVEERIKAALDLKKQAKTWGEDMMKNYATAIEDNSWRPEKKATAAADQIKRVLGFSEPEEGPLSDFHTYGPDMMKLLAQGIEQSQWQVVQAARGVASSLRQTLEGTTLTAQLDQKTVPISPGVTLNIANFNNYSDSDIRELTNEIMQTAASFAARKEAVFA